MNITPDEIVESVLKNIPKDVPMIKVAQSKEDSEPGKIASLLETLAYDEKPEELANKFKNADSDKQEKIAEMRSLVDAVANVI